MTGPAPTLSWTDANQQVLVAEFARLKAQLGGRAPAEEPPIPQLPFEASAVGRLVARFGLSGFERDILLLCAAVEMDSELAALCAQGSGKHGASFALALGALSDPHWSALTPLRPLRRFRLLELDDTCGLTQGRLRIDERVLHYLAGLNYLDARLRSLFRLVPRAAHMAEAHRKVVAAAASRMENTGDAAVSLVSLAGDDALGQADVAAEIAAARGLGLYRVRAQELPAAVSELETLNVLWERETCLLQAALLISCGDEAAPQAALRLAESLESVVFLSGSQPARLERQALCLTVDKPEPTAQRRLWLEILGLDEHTLDEGTRAALDGIAGQFKLSARTIQHQHAQFDANLASGTDRPTALWSACRASGRSGLEEMAQRIDEGAQWDDLILPEPTKATLRRIAAQVRNRLKVHREWGFAGKGRRGLGISALFSGESGTGKTMAAEVLARELRLDLYRVDLAAMVSKYIGETEKNLRRVFDAAEECGAVLLFDEADALFGKRSEVKDSHDRYANIEVSYLLQRMETYSGLAILTSNLKSGIDVAFQRRLRFMVQFPFPDQTQREAIWRASFPRTAPLLDIDFAKLARLSMAGGNIRNIVLTAAFQAADSGNAITMAQLREAAQYEAGKRERALSDAEVRGWT